MDNSALKHTFHTSLFRFLSISDIDKLKSLCLTLIKLEIPLNLREFHLMCFANEDEIFKTFPRIFTRVLTVKELTLLFQNNTLRKFLNDKNIKNHLKIMPKCVTLEEAFPGKDENQIKVAEVIKFIEHRDNSTVYTINLWKTQSNFPQAFFEVSFSE